MLISSSVVCISNVILGHFEILFMKYSIPAKYLCKVHLVTKYKNTMTITTVRYLSFASS